MGNNCEQKHPQNEFNNEQMTRSKASKSIFKPNIHSPHYQYAQPKNPPPLSQKASKIIEEELRKKPLKKEENGQGKFYSWYYIKSRKLYYEGNWKQRNPHGKGKIYFEDYGYFQGYFKEGQANCEDGLYIMPDKSIYRGGFKNSNMSGLGRFYQANSKVIYEGQWKEGKPHGKGKQVFSNGNQYEGKFENGYKHGNGVFKWDNGSVYKGQFRLGYMWGQGIFKKQNSYFQGQFYKNVKQSDKQITMKTEKGVYHGYLKKGQMEGEGTFIWNDKKVYKGGFMNGKLHGQGQITYPNGQKVTGVWNQGQNQSLSKIREGK